MYHQVRALKPNQSQRRATRKAFARPETPQAIPAQLPPPTTASYFSREPAAPNGPAFVTILASLDCMLHIIAANRPFICQKKKKNNEDSNIQHPSKDDNRALRRLESSGCRPKSQNSA